ncbi:MAG: cytochrome c oxidase subunit 2A [Chloroflexi bacterium]|nr:MAG: cytochrome c oxidase subunit 2A [Chloroflexota bacterium]
MTQENQPTPNEEQEQYGPPRGAMAFVLLMLLMYIGYWFLTYMEFISRGGA